MKARKIELLLLNNNDIFTSCYFHTVTSRRVLHAVSKILKKNNENVINRKFNAFDVEYPLFHCDFTKIANTEKNMNNPHP